jgi:hypothetical protein
MLSVGIGSRIFASSFLRPLPSARRNEETKTREVDARATETAGDWNGPVLVFIDQSRNPPLQSRYLLTEKPL